MVQPFRETAAVPKFFSTTYSPLRLALPPRSGPGES